MLWRSLSHSMELLLKQIYCLYFSQAQGASDINFTTESLVQIKFRLVDSFLFIRQLLILNHCRKYHLYLKDWDSLSPLSFPNVRKWRRSQTGCESSLFRWLSSPKTPARLDIPVSCYSSEINVSKLLMIFAGNTHHRRVTHMRMAVRKRFHWMLPAEHGH